MSIFDFIDDIFKDDLRYPGYIFDTIEISEYGFIRLYEANRRVLNPSYFLEKHITSKNLNDVLDIVLEKDTVGRNIYQQKKDVSIKGEIGFIDGILKNSRIFLSYEINSFMGTTLISIHGN